MARMSKGLRCAAAVTALSALALTGCTGPVNEGSGEGSDSEKLVVGTTDKVVSLDPAAAYDNASMVVMTQVYPFLLSSKPGSAEPEPDMAESAEFTSPTEYTVKLKEGLKWANGHDLTSSDVKFSFDRMVKIADPEGPSALLANLDSVDTPDETTVVFNLKAGNDQTWPGVLTTSAAPIVDEEVLSATEVTPDKEIVDADAFAGPYTIDSYTKNELISYKAYEDYDGILGAPKMENVDMKYYADANNLKLEVQQGNIDVAYRSLSATDVEDLEKDDNVKVIKGPGGELRYIVFNFDTMPFGAKSENPDADKALSVRQAMAHALDREAIAEQVYKGTYTPAYSYVPTGLPGAIEPLKEMYGDGSGGPDMAKAKSTLEDAGIKTPVSINLQYNGDHYGPSSGDEYAMVKSQLEKEGLFKVNLQSTEWVQYSEQRTQDAYPMYQLGWFPDYSDADNYLSPFFAPGNFLANHYEDKGVTELITEQRVTIDEDKRADLIGQIQTEVAKDLSTLPLLQGNSLAVAGKDVKGVQDTLDASYKFRLAVISK
ncbi:ABC transporter substrate-binding protein [Arthrobacter roseus]|uniref:ABC transporter substrate-binding protein n=1 Tax=Arthrobacter roseus TaxID=136274 RepID=UPI001965BFAF|nr:ABC transporter substrate-binding protein [Arthrobacter roseus]MBM7849126.1 peptide/nickel transport system substrate-binding protein [Arthrobacter roseus]